MIRESRPTESKPVEEADPDDRLKYDPEAGQTDRRARRELEAGTGGTKKTAASTEGPASPRRRSWLRTVLLTLTILAMIAFLVLVFSLLSSLILL